MWFFFKRCDLFTIPRFITHDFSSDPFTRFFAYFCLILLHDSIIACDSFTHSFLYLSRINDSFLTCDSFTHDSPLIWFFSKWHFLKDSLIFSWFFLPHHPPTPPHIHFLLFYFHVRVISFVFGAPGHNTRLLNGLQMVSKVQYSKQHKHENTYDVLM